MNKSLVYLSVLLWFIRCGALMALGNEDFPKIDKARVSTSLQRNTPSQIRYIPSQAIAAFGERLLPNVRANTSGIVALAPDLQKPVPGGIEFLDGVSGSFMIHHRRAGAECFPGAVFKLRMEMACGLATAALGIRKDEKIIPFSKAKQIAMQVFPGRVEYVFELPDVNMRAEVTAISPFALPAYGLIARVRLYNNSPDSQTVQVVGCATAGAEVPQMICAGDMSRSQFLNIDVSGFKSPLVSLGDDPNKLVLHNYNYHILAGFDSSSFCNGSTVVTRPVEVQPAGDVAVYFAAFIDSPGFDEPAVRKRLETYFAKNPNLRASSVSNMISEAIDTFARIVVEGDEKFRAFRQKPKAAFSDCEKAWKHGCYRTEPVFFELPDKKMESMANLVANDLFPGLVQPPGLVHDAKYGDTWSFIFSYRHVHAASDLALEHEAMDYLRLLSANQLPNGRISSVRMDINTPAHPTEFDESYIDSLYHYYKWTGDLGSVREVWPVIVRAAEYLDKNLDPDNDNLYKDIIHQWKSDFDNRGPSSSFETSLVWKAYRDLAEFARLLGDAKRAETYAKKTDAIYDAVQKQLWSDEWAMFGPRCPLNILRLHPQSLEVEIPIWTGIVDPYQAEALADWYFANNAFFDSNGGIWMYDNDWWPAVWSQHLAAPGDYLMIARSLMITGRYEEGCRILQTIAESSFRWTTPGFNYVFDEYGRQGGIDPATVQGAWTRSLVEGIFGVAPHLDEQHFVLTPRFPKTWDNAHFKRPGLEINWKRQGQSQQVTVQTPRNVYAIINHSVEEPVKSVLLDGKPVEFTVNPAMRHGLVTIRTNRGGGTVTVITEPSHWDIEAPKTASPGEEILVKVTDVDSFKLEDRFKFFELSVSENNVFHLRLKRTGSGRAVIFIHCQKGNLKWIQPVSIATMPVTAKQFQKRTVADVPADGNFVPLDLTDAYNDDIQKCFSHKWQWDAYDTVTDKTVAWMMPTDKITYWTMPLFKLAKSIERKIWVEKIPFYLGSMGPGDAAARRNLLMLANTRPYEMPNRASIEISGRNLQKVYILSLNMNLPQKCYLPAVEVIVHYSDGSTETKQLIPPLNFDSFYQDFGINTVALPLPAEPAYGIKEWANYFRCDLRQHHLTMTDIICDPMRKVDELEFRSIATETFIGIAGVTLVTSQ